MNEEEKKTVNFFYNLRATIDESNMLFERDINVKHGKETIRQITIILNLIEKLQKENEELKRLMAHKNGYTKLLEEDLFENCENFVISKDRIKEQIKRYAELSDDCYSEWKKLPPFDEDYKNIRDKGMCCDAIVNALQELLKG